MAVQKDVEQKNPFLVYVYVSPRYFCDREEETAKMLSALDNGRFSVLAQCAFYLRRQQPASDGRDVCFYWMYGRFEGHTWYMQTMLNRLYEQERSVKEVGQVERVLVGVIEENAMIYQKIIPVLLFVYVWKTYICTIVSKLNMERL